LKRRIFYSDRVEKIEKVLVQMQLIPKETIYCSSDQLENFGKAVMENDSLGLVY